MDNNDDVFKKSAQKFSRHYALAHMDVINDRIIELMNKYKVSSEDAGEIDACYTVITIKGLPLDIQKRMANRKMR